MNKLPLVRNTDIIVQILGAEVLIYDLKTHKAYSLNETSAIIYQACDGKTSFEELKAKHKFTDDLIFLALDDLKKENLIEEGNSPVSPFTGMSRREVIRKVGLGSMIALPVIFSLIAPTAAHALSSVTCNTGGSCGCILPIGSGVTTCSGADARFTSCGDGCVCEVSRVGCIDQGDGTELCQFGNCIVAVSS